MTIGAAKTTAAASAAIRSRPDETKRDPPDENRCCNREQHRFDVEREGGVAGNRDHGGERIELGTAVDLPGIEGLEVAVQDPLSEHAGVGLIRTAWLMEQQPDPNDCAESRLPPPRVQ